jgi:hypothetical protein
MATASRSRHPRRTAAPISRTRLVWDALRPWLLPGAAGLALVGFAVCSALELLAPARALAGGILAALVLLVWVGERPLVSGPASARARLLGAALGTVWLAACYLPFHARLFPGPPLIAAVPLSTSGGGLPLVIPAAGHAAIDLLLEGRLAPNPTGGAAPPVRFRLTLKEGDGGVRQVDGRFEDTLMTRRLGRRGTAVVHQTHTTDVRTVPNPARQDLVVTEVALDPPTAQTITLSAFTHPLPGPAVLGLAGALLLAAVVAFDRLGPVSGTDGALTLATTAVAGTAVIFWTSNAAHPDFHTLIGSAIFGGPLGFAAGALVWWIAKRLIVRAAR